MKGVKGWTLLTWLNGLVDLSIGSEWIIKGTDCVWVSAGLVADEVVDIVIVTSLVITGLISE